MNPAFPTPRLKRINLEITHRCNLRCRFCFMLHAGKLNRPTEEMTAQEIFRFVDSVHEGGDDVRFYLTGGEPLLRPDCLDIVAHIKEKGFRCGLNSNGTFLSCDRARALAALDPDFIIFSLHGTAQTHDRICGKKGTFRKVVSCVRSFLRWRNNTQVILSCTLTPENFSQAGALYRWGVRLGADRVILENYQFLRKQEAMHHRRVWMKYFKEAAPLVTPLNEYVPEANRTKSFFEKFRDIPLCRTTSLETRPRLTPVLWERWYQPLVLPRGVCRSVWETMIVQADGSVRLCQLYDKEIGNVRTVPYKSLWAGAAMNRFRRALLSEGGLFPGCVRCCQRFEISSLF